MTPFAIAGIQMPITTGNNLDAMRHRLDLVMHLYPWVQMVLFSELATYGPLPHHAEELPGPAENAFREMARKHGLWLLPGSLFERRNGKLHNTAPVINPDGKVVARYRKMFPFRPFEEGVAPGEEHVVFDVDGVGRFGVSICYDIWFPETTRTLTAMGAEVLLHPVLTHTVDRDAELNIARATAAMFQCYVFDINGLHAGGNGQSTVVDPAGRTLHLCGVNDEIVPIEIDLDQVRRQRERGIRVLGQPLKSFRDCTATFEIYDPERRDLAYLQSLGPLVKPSRPSGSVTPEAKPEVTATVDTSARTVVGAAAEEPVSLSGTS